MAEQFDLFSEDDSGLLAELLRTSRELFVKKLSNNDRDWAQREEKHQGGVYIPRNERDSGFFPPLVAKELRKPDADEIREAWLQTEWPQFGVEKRSRLVNYTSKGQETHMTRVPKEAFAELSPASWLVMSRADERGDPRYICLTVDSASDDATVLLDTLGIDAAFTVGILDPEAAVERERDEILDFAEEVARAWLAGEIAGFANNRAAMPATAELALLARANFLERYKLPSLNPFELEYPGDAVREISRKIEWDLFREFQRRERGVELVRIVLGDDPIKTDMKGVVRRLVDATGAVDRLMLSASQQRKSRAGYSFEHHIEAMLEAGNIPFAKQVVMDAKKRPDFVLPSLAHLKKPYEGAQRGLILSAKTTLRERWKQVQREMGGSDLFLATVDESIAANAIEDMASMGINLVVPETLKKSRDTEYVRHDNVLDFATFFRGELQVKRLPAWA
ncbi:MAG: restriction endonuclease [Sphingomonas sp.]|nr:restriction endonuclease [Sphingomonas sp.]|tara:strand:- start:82 stop:1434 length:1353 start_codon:yes stop_codon:yes gene_type:complete